MGIAAKKHHILDDVSRWGDEVTFVRPDFDVAAFQKKIDAVAGISRDGKSIVVLRWMRSPECCEEFYTEWTPFGTPVKSELRPKYRAFGIALDNGDVCEIPPPRWVLEQRYEPEQLAQTWETERFSTHPEFGVKVPVKGELPRDGYYNHLWTIGTHDDNCCKDAIDNNMVCWGDYRLPGEADLRALRNAIARRDSDEKIDADPFGAPKESTMKELARRTNKRLREDKKQTAQLRKEVMSDALRPHLHRHTEDPSVLQHGKYHFVDKRKWKLKETETSNGSSESGTR